MDGARPEALGKVSGWGWSLGYFGGILALATAMGADLAVLPSSPPVVVEGPQVLPDLVPPGDAAVFLVATPDFQRSVLERRPRRGEVFLDAKFGVQTYVEHVAPAAAKAARARSASWSPSRRWS